jgi:hypothetical protein
VPPLWALWTAFFLRAYMPRRDGRKVHSALRTARHLLQGMPHSAPSQSTLRWLQWVQARGARTLAPRLSLVDSAVMARLGRYVLLPTDDNLRLVGMQSYIAATELEHPAIFARHAGVCMWGLPKYAAK